MTPSNAATAKQARLANRYRSLNDIGTRLDRNHMKIPRNKKTMALVPKTGDRFTDTPQQPIDMPPTQLRLTDTPRLLQKKVSTSHTVPPAAARAAAMTLMNPAATTPAGPETAHKAAIKAMIAPIAAGPPSKIPVAHSENFM
jgi:hypothetical protein